MHMHGPAGTTPEELAARSLLLCAHYWGVKTRPDQTRGLTSRKATAACARIGEQCNHHTIITHVVRREMKTSSGLLARHFFSAPGIMICATQTSGIQRQAYA